MRICWFCTTDTGAGARPSREETCPKCKVALRCCRNCRFYDRSAHNQCREPAAEWVRDKELGNFCEYFEFADRAAAPGSGKPDNARRKFDDLFKG